MAEEKRRLIYELLVQAKGAKDFQKELLEAKSAMSLLGSAAMKLGGVVALAFTVKGIAETLDEMTRFNQQLAVLGVTGDDAAKGLAAVQTIAFQTGQTMKSVGEVFAQAIELQQTLGGTTEDAAQTASAFVRAAVAEGKSAEVAAQQLETLQFAIDRGSIKTKEFTQLLKENETFQQAAQQALGKTTGQLTDMAEKGEITVEALVKIEQKFEELADHRDVALTFDGITESLKTLGKTFVEAFAQGAGFDTKIGETGLSGMQIFIANIRGLALEIGGVVRLLFNFAQEMANVIVFWGKVLTDPLHIVQHWDDATKQTTQDLKDMEDALHDIKRGLVMGTDQDPDLNPANIAAKQAEKAARDQQAIERAKLRDVVQGYKEANEAYEKFLKKKAEDDEKARKDAAEKAKREAERKAKEDFDRMVREAKEHTEEREREAQAQKDLNDWLDQSAEEAGEKAMDSIQASGEEMLAESEKMFDKMYEDVVAFQDAIGGAFYDLFTGNIHNVRDFFREILQGLQRVYAQQLAMQIATSSKGWLSWLLGVESGPTPSGPTGQIPAGIGPAEAKGGAYSDGMRLAMAKGGVVSGPTVFPMAHGYGLMGEAGPEAVMPLRRMRDGSLGVRSATPQVNVINNTGVAATASVSNRDGRLDIILEAAKLGASLAEQRMNASLSSGYGPTAQSMQRTYGLRRSF